MPTRFRHRSQTAGWIETRRTATLLRQLGIHNFRRCKFSKQDNQAVPGRVYSSYSEAHNPRPLASATAHRPQDGRSTQNSHSFAPAWDPQLPTVQIFEITNSDVPGADVRCPLKYTTLAYSPLEQPQLIPLNKFRRRQNSGTRPDSEGPGVRLFSCPRDKRTDFRCRTQGE